MITLQTNEVILTSTNKLQKVLNLEAPDARAHTRAGLVGDTVISEEYSRTIA